MFTGSMNLGIHVLQSHEHFMVLAVSPKGTEFWRRPDRNLKKTSKNTLSWDALCSINYQVEFGGEVASCWNIMCSVNVSWSKFHLRFHRFERGLRAPWVPVLWRCANPWKLHLYSEVVQHQQVDSSNDRRSDNCWRQITNDSKIINFISNTTHL